MNTLVSILSFDPLIRAVRPGLIPMAIMAGVALGAVFWLLMERRRWRLAAAAAAAILGFVLSQVPVALDAAQLRHVVAGKDYQIQTVSGRVFVSGPAPRTILGKAVGDGAAHSIIDYRTTDAAAVDRVLQGEGLLGGSVSSRQP